MKNDMQRAVDSVLSGLTTTPEMQEQLIRTAMESTQRRSRRHGARVAESSREAGERANRVKLKMSFSLSFGLPHMIVAAIVVIVVMIAPLFAPGQREYFKTWQSEDMEHYMVQGFEEEQNQQVVDAEQRPAEPGQYSLQSLEEAAKHYGSGLALPTWIPERFAVLSYEVAIFEELRSCTVIHSSDDGTLIYQATDYFEPTSAYSYVEQDGEGEFITLSDGRQIYLTTNASYYTVTWITGTEHTLFSGSITREEAIRMAESVKIQ